MKILFIGVNPKDTRQLRLQDEINIIKDILDSQPIRNKFKLKVRNAATKSKMLNLIRNYMPDILHISGHGNDDGTIIFEDSQGQSEMIYTQQLGDLLNNYSAYIKCVVLSSCYSLNDLENFSENIKYTVGMKIAIGNSRALEFTKSFYDELLQNEDFERSFEIAKDYIDLSNNTDLDILKIMINDSIDPPKPPPPSVNWGLVLIIIFIIMLLGSLFMSYLFFDIIE